MVLLSLVFFLLTYHQEEIKRQRRPWVQEIFKNKKKKIEQEVCNDLLQKIGVNDKEWYFKLFVQ